MSLLFSDASSDVVLCGSAAALDNPDTGTVLAWVYPTSTSNTLRIIAEKGSSEGSRGWSLRKRATDGTAFQLVRFRATTNQSAPSSTGQLAANTWAFIGGSFDIPGGGPKAYKGSLTAIAADVTSGANNGVGTKSDDSADELALGNESAFAVARDLGWPGRIAWVGIWNRVLTLGEIQAQQFRPHPTSGCVAYYMLGYNGASTQPDWSGSANAGTVTGATVADHVPIAFRRHPASSPSYTVAAPAALTFIPPQMFIPDLAPMMPVPYQ